jgi:hypothetical protein
MAEWVVLLVRILENPSRISALLTEVSHGLHQSLETNSGMVTITSLNALSSSLFTLIRLFDAVF